VAGGVVVLVCGFIVLEPDSHLLLLLLLLLSSFETAVCARASRCFFFAQRDRDRGTELFDFLLCENKRRRPCFFLKSSRTHALRERRVHHDDCLSEMTRNDPYSCCSGRFKARVCVVSCCSSHQCYGALKL
jgi:hypothetical protein